MDGTGNAVSYYLDNLEINPTEPVAENFVADYDGDVKDVTIPNSLLINAVEVFSNIAES